MNSKGYSISGSDLCKYYARPRDVKEKKKINIEVESESDDDFQMFEEKEEEEISKKYVTIGTQTDYRESEAQTDPWDPPFVINRVYKKPEVLSFKDLTYGSGLPAGPLEIEYIIESRKNKLLDGLPEEITYEDFLKQKKLISDQVKNKWNYKISKLTEKQLEKLRIRESNLAEELSKQSERKEKFLKNVWTKKNYEMTKTNSMLKKKLIKEIKMLEEKTKSDIQKFDLDFIHSYRPPKQQSDVADNKRDSLNEEISHMMSKYYNNPDGLEKVTSWLERKKTVLYNEIPIVRSVRKSKQEKVTEQAYQDLLEKKHTKMPPKFYKEDYDKEGSTVSSIMNEVEFEILEIPEEGIDLVTVFQKVLQGRAYQKQMIDLIEKHKDTLDVLLP